MRPRTPPQPGLSRFRRLLSGHWGAAMIGVPNSRPDEVLTVTFKDSLYHGKYTDYFAGQSIELDASTRLSLKPWGCQVFVK